MDQSLYKAVVETMQDGLLIVDPCGRILCVNPAFERMTGYAGQELQGQPCTVLNCTGCTVYGRGAGMDWCAMFAKGMVRNRRCELTMRDGRTLHVVKQATALHDDEGELTGAVETLRDITEVVRREEQIQALRETLLHETEACGIVGRSPAIQELIALIANASRSDAPVVIYGESGVGKELVARALHDYGPRATEPFIKVNCTSLNENLLESELFGHVKGAFTGADRNRVGRFEAAGEGTIFLDEIGDISPAIQVKLLRVLESKEIERVGDHTPVKVNARVVSATHRDLDTLVAEGAFRGDLFYRIDVVPLRVPPLRERKEDIPLLAQSFVDKIAARTGKPIAGLTLDALSALMAYDWPGNVRELRNTIEYAFVMCHADLIALEHLTPRLAEIKPEANRQKLLFLPNRALESSPKGASGKGQHRENGAEADRQRLLQALQQTGGNRTQAARILGISRVAVWKKLKKYGLDGTNPAASKCENAGPAVQ